MCPHPQHVIIMAQPGRENALQLDWYWRKPALNHLFANFKKMLICRGGCYYLPLCERNIADPGGSVHDPIYQGAGAMGAAAFRSLKQGPVPKPMGESFCRRNRELHPCDEQLLKVLKTKGDPGERLFTEKMIEMFPVTSTIFFKWAAS